jgi:hypothetical protein
MKRIVWLSVILALVLPGCGTQQIKELQAKYEDKNNQLIGKSYDELVKGMGVPSGEARLSDGSRIVEYSIARTRISGGGSYPFPVSTYIPHQNGAGGFWVYSERERSMPVSSRTDYCKLES